MNEQIEQLKADKAALEAAQIVMRKHGCGISKYIEQTVVVIQETINELEKQADDWNIANKTCITLEHAQAWAAEKLGVEK
jgi:hypothetical protein